MPMKPLKPCRHPGCPNLTDKRYCEDHKNLNGNKRKNSYKRGYGSKWSRERKAFLRLNQLCIRCLAEGEIKAATVVDHIKPHRGDKKLFWDKSNWQALCKKCHDKKTMTEDRYVEYKY